MKNREELLLRIIHCLAENLKTDIALKGGMLLRLLNCPRSTQDVDYVLISGESRKKWANRLEEILAKIDGAKVEEVRLNSRGIFMDVATVEEPILRAKIEITLQSSLNLPGESLSTAVLSGQYSLSARIVNTMALAEAFSNKIAAALERNVLRDLYDIAQFEPLTAFDVSTLQKRFASLSLDRKKPQTISFKEGAEMLKKKSDPLTEEKLEAELYPLLPQDHRAGLLSIIKAAVNRLATKLEI